MYKTLIVSIAALFVAGCTTIGRVEPHAQPPSEDESFFLVGIKPENTRVAFDPRILNYGVLYQNIYRGVVFIGRPEDGYIMGRSRSDDVVVFARATLERSDGRKMQAMSCGGRPGMTFKAVPGKVVYPGDVVINEVDGKLQIKMEFNPDAARKIIEEKYPAMKEKLVVRPFELMPDKRMCGDIVVVPR